MFVSHHTLKWTRTCRSHGRHPHAHTAHFLLNRHIEILESTGGTDRAGVCLAAARHASGLGPVAYDDPVDLSEYDIAYTKEDE